MITPDQCRAARALLRWTQEHLANEAAIGLSTVEDFEAHRRQPIQRNLQAIEKTLQVAGVIFIPKNGGGPGVRLAR
ncbi:MAG: helix-turn-helix transcriptional regulator [bacterium]|nr:helix-turn-helix transcriptional regulator [bacterium]